VYSVARDITEQKAREEELITARRIAEEANASKSLFLSRMSHELRTPMNSILGFAQLMEMGELNEMQESAVRHILQSGQHLLGLINEVLDIARIETGKISLSIEQVNVTLTIKEVCALLDPLAQKNAVTISVGNSLQKDMFIHADQQRTVQILTNLINNAIKYNKENGKVMIEQSVRLNESGKEVVRISIKDTGVGIKQDDLSRLFTPFERIGAQKTKIEGTRLGLAVVKELIHVLGGELGV
ncbi:MAG: sensor histidine kinase, partial [Bacteroidota bacterium]